MYPDNRIDSTCPNIAFIVLALIPFLQQLKDPQKIDPNLRFYATELPMQSLKQLDGQPYWYGSDSTARNLPSIQSIPPHYEYRGVRIKDGEFIGVTTDWQDEKIEPLRKDEHMQTRRYWYPHEIVTAIETELRDRFYFYDKESFKTLLQYVGEAHK